MDYRKTNAPSNTVTRDMMKLSSDTGNVYETVAIIGKRANQIAVEMKQDLEKKLQEFASYNDNLEEVFENREQIEISRYYEKLPKPTLIAAKEYEDGKVYFAKTPSTPEDQSIGVLNGIRALLEELGVAPDCVTGVAHGTTVATNTLLERNGAVTALITTKGFSNCVIFVNTDSVSVVVEDDNLKSEEIAQIQNIISREMNAKVENIHIMTKK